LYASILVKNIGWHDSAENATGILSSTLATDVQTLNGASTEALSAYAEAFSSMIGGIIIAFIFSWKVALVAIGVAPFMIIGGVIGAKIDAQNAGNDDKDKELFKKDDKKVSSKDKENAEKAKKISSNPDLLANDAICNYRTVHGFVLDQSIADSYNKML